MSARYSGSCGRLIRRIAFCFEDSERAFHIVPVRQPLDIMCRQAIENCLENPVLPIVSGTFQFEVLKQEKKPFKMVRGQPVIYRIERMKRQR